MITLRQLEAFYWAGRLGSFQAAAQFLHATPSAISKRLSELESALNVVLFDRAQRRARLTPKGEEILALARDLLALRKRIVNAAKRSSPTSRRFRLGVTDLTAMTWLPTLIHEIRNAHPSVIVDPEVDASGRLIERLKAGNLDLVVCPDAFRSDDLNAMALDSVEYAWMCSPAYLISDTELSLAEIATHTVIVQEHASGLGDLVQTWLSDHGVTIPSVITSSNLTALEALTLSGLGISYLPRRALSPLVAAGRLDIIKSRPALPRILYVCMVRKSSDDDFLRYVAETAVEVCDFSAR